MRLADLLSADVLRSAALISPGQHDREVLSVHVLEPGDDVSEAPPESAVVLTAAAAGAVRGFRLDVLMARAAHAGVSVLVLPVPVGHLPQPDADLSQQMCVLSVDASTKAGDLVAGLMRTLVGGDSAVLAGVERFGVELQSLAPGDSDEEALLAALAEAGIAAELVDVDTPTNVGWRSLPADEARAWHIRRSRLPEPVETMMLLSANGWLLGSARDHVLPDRRLSSLLGELLVCDESEAQELRNRALALGLRVDGWHQAMAITVDGPAAGPDVIAREEHVRRVAVRTLATESSSWTWTHRGSGMVLVRTWAREPTASQRDAAARAAHETDAAVRATIADGGVALTCGLSSVHGRLAGLQRAASEARSAARYARTRTRPGLATFDEFGLQQVLAEWYLSDRASSAGAALLAPLMSLPPARRDALIETLRVYLDHQGSVVDTARALFLHRNAVRQRIDQIKNLLDTDLSDADERLSLHLACRGYALAAASRPAL